MAAFERVKSGIDELDETLDNIRLGDNVVWQGSNLKEFSYFVNPYVKQALEDERNLIYINFGQHEPLIPMTDEDFEESCRFIEEMGFAKVHVFPYSRRTGTDAADMPDQIPNSVKTERAAKMAERAEAVRQKFLEEQIGKTESVLIESVIKDGMMNGYTMNYTPVVIPAVKSLLCTVQEVVITGVSGDVCTGRIKNPPVGYDPMGMF